MRTIESAFLSGTLYDLLQRSLNLQEESCINTPSYLFLHPRIELPYSKITQYLFRGSFQS